MNELRHILLIVMVWSATVACPQAIQRGRVVEQNSGYKPLPGVQIDVKDASPKVSDSKGCFLLEFSDKRNGQMLFVNSISKPDYMVINQKSIDQWNFSPETELHVVMSLRTRFEQSLREYYNIGYSRYKKRYEALIIQLKEERQKEWLSENAYKVSLDSVKNQYKNELEQLDYYADIFARVNKDELRGIDSIAMNLVGQGKLDSAIVIYERERYYEKFSRQSNAVKTLTDEIEKMIPSLRNYADMCAFAGGKDNYQKVGKVLRTIAMSDTTNYDYTFDYMSFLYRQKHYREIIMWGERALRMNLDVDRRNNVLSILAESYGNVRDFEKARIAYKEIQEQLQLQRQEIDDRLLRKWFDQLVSFSDYAVRIMSLSDDYSIEILMDKYNDLLKLIKRLERKVSKVDVNLSAFYKIAYIYIFPSMLDNGRTKEVKSSCRILSELYNNLNSESKNFIDEEILLLGKVIDAELKFLDNGKMNDRIEYEVLDERFEKLYRSNPEAFSCSYLHYLYYMVKCYHVLGLFDEALIKIDKAFELVEKIDLSQDMNALSLYGRLFTISNEIYKKGWLLDKREQSYMKMLGEYKLIMQHPIFRKSPILIDEWCQNVVEFAKIEMGLNHFDVSKACLIQTLEELERQVESEQRDWNRSLLYNKLGDVYMDMESDSAKLCYEKCLTICEKLVKLDQNKYMRHQVLALKSLGIYYRNKLADCPSALEALYKGLDLSKEISSSDSIFLVSDIEMELGHTYSQLGNDDLWKEHLLQSLKYAEQGLAWRLEHLNNQDPNILTSYAAIGHIYREFADYSKALKYYLQALPILKNIYGEEDMNVVDINCAIGDVYSALKEYNKALEFYDQAVKIIMRFYGKGHVGIAVVYTSMANVYCMQNDYEKALECLKSALEIRVKMLGKDDSAVSETYNYIGFVYSNQENHVEALKNYKQALDITIKLFGKEHISAAVLYDNIGKTHCARKEYDLALEFLNRAVVIWEREYGKESYAVADAYNNIGSIYSLQKNHSKAMEETLKSLNIYKVLAKQDTIYNSYLAMAMGNMSYYVIFNKQFEQSEQYARDALALDSSHIWIKTNLAIALILKGKCDEGKEIIREIMNLQSEDGRTFKEVMLEDISAIEQAGIIPESIQLGMEQVKKMLQ